MDRYRDEVFNWLFNSIGRLPVEQQADALLEEFAFMLSVLDSEGICDLRNYVLQAPEFGEDVHGRMEREHILDLIDGDLALRKLRSEGLC